MLPVSLMPLVLVSLASPAPQSQNRIYSEGLGLRMLGVLLVLLLRSYLLHLRELRTDLLLLKRASRGKLMSRTGLAGTLKERVRVPEPLKG